LTLNSLVTSSDIFVIICVIVHAENGSIHVNSSGESALKDQSLLHISKLLHDEEEADHQ
jgi:hypothetical protein